MAKYRILALDGGGVRGVLTAVMMKRIDEKFPGWRAKLNLIAGTSTGGLLALGLGKGLGPDDFIGFYKNDAPSIFAASFFDKVKSLGSYIGAKYASGPLETALKNLLGEQTRLSDLRPLIVVPTFSLDSDYAFDDGVAQQNIETWKPKVFHNDPSLPDDTDGAELAYRVGMRTSAAPTYFPTYGSYIDGGVFANNPSMVALAQALMTKGAPPALTDLVLLNLGTGVHQNAIKSQDNDWGGVQWIANGLVDLVLDGSMDVAKFECRRLLGDRYYRLSPYLGQDIPLDDPGLIDTLIGIAQQLDMTRVFDWVEKQWL